MEQETNTMNTAQTDVVETASPVAPVSADAQHDRRGGRRDRNSFQKNPRKAPRREARAKPEFDQKIISIRRVTRVVTGGRRFSFSVAMVAGNRKGSVGVGIGKAGDTSLAIEKALRDAKKNMITVRLTKDMSISHDAEAKYCSSRVRVMPAPGKGVIAGSAVRSVIELAGIKNIGAKIFSPSKNRINNARAAIEALRKLGTVKKVAPAPVADTTVSA